ncbi:VWD domain-containing protein [Actinocrispum wychmicini]|uniref:von Willebrand factor type D domain-containing protein n=1 Tax=Actinocrispum wychmicini TaxID=1213861 RepID=A0A4R2JRA0_9PSEU|nr:VWD domain-containing protein [Actinocrispum wychmicini]TCO62781.1 von Willebrand factor type D domain-containing protein [Actinocrispum wychmicini]
MRLFGSAGRSTRGLFGAVVFAVVTAVSVTGAVSSAAQVPVSQRDWQNQIAQVPQPSKGCFTADYPRLAWQAAPCAPAPDIPMPPYNGPRPLVVGNRNDISARVPSGFISTAIGSFDVADVLSESGPIGNTGPSEPNAYTLQMNTNFFTSPACAGSPNPECRGWEQFVYANKGSSGLVFIQYWLTRYNTTCPAGWNQFTFSTGTNVYCYRNNSSGAALVPSQPITNLADLSLSGQVSAAGDSVVLFVGTTAYSKSGDNFVSAAAGWNEAEFNVFGYGGNTDGGGTASFNDGASLQVRTRTIYGGTAAPLCVAHGFTAEKNNLDFGTPAPPATRPGPAVIFVEDTVGGATSNCASATTIGDVHAHTVAGLAYDFQATGDFELAQVGSDFDVQARHVSGAPTWPDASVNQAIGTRMGSTKVTVCGGPKLVVDGRPVKLPDGRTISLPSGVDINLADGVYVVTDQTGNSVRVTQQPEYLDVSVGVGTWPTRVRGLLGNPDNNVKLLESRDGTVFSVPLSFEDLYSRYGDSWRVEPGDSLLSPCGELAEQANPKKPFFADDLEPRLREKARAVCLEAEIDQAWLDDCTLDVAVLGTKAATAYVGKRPPVMNGNK